MAFFEIANFKPGLDTRRSELTSVPGTLQTLNNAHVNPGGEIQKRMAFVPMYLPNGTFGLQSLITGLQVFGSEATPGGLPAGVSYQQLTSPNTASPNMIGVISSTLFEGESFVAAEFNDNYTYTFYNGTLVSDFTNGLVTSWRNTTAQIAQELTNEINGSATSPVSGEPVYTASLVGSTISVFSTPNISTGTPYVVTSTVVSNAGTITENLTSTGSPSTAAAQAVAQFSILAASQSGGSAASGAWTVGASNVNNNDVFFIGPSGNQTVYTFVNTLDNTGAHGYQIKIGANAGATATNFAAAINANGTPGTQYCTPVVANTYVTAGVVGTVVTLTSIVSGTTGNSYIGTTFPSQTRLTPANNTNLTGGSNSGGAAVASVVTGSNSLLSASVPFTTTAVQLASDVANNITANSGSNGGFTAQANNGTVTIFSPLANAGTYTQDITIIVTGQVAIQQMAFSVSGLTANTSNISSITVGGGSNIMTATITYQDAGNSTETPLAWLQRVASNIFANSGTSGFTAVAVAAGTNSITGAVDTLYVSPLSSTSSSTPGVLAVTYSTITTINSTGSTALSAILSQATINGTIHPGITTGLEGQDTTTPGYYATNGTVTAIAVQGTAPYTYKWFFNGTGISKLNPTSANKASTAWAATVSNTIGAPFTEAWACTITDSSSPAQVATTSNLTIYA